MSHRWEKGRMPGIIFKGVLPKEKGCEPRWFLGKNHLHSVSSVEEIEHKFLQQQRESNLCPFPLQTGHLKRP